MSTIEKNSMKDKRASSMIALRFLNLGPLFSLLVLGIILSITTKSFLTSANLINLLRQTVLYAIIAMGATYILIGGCIDLSIGATVGLSGSLAVIVANATQNSLIGILVGIVTGVVIGLINGFLVTKFSLMPFIVTLSTKMIISGMSMVSLGGYSQSIKLKTFRFLAQGYVGAIPMPIIIMIVLFLIGHFYLKMTRTGRYIHAIGSNIQTAKLAGVNVDKYKVITFVVSGVCAACTGIILAGRVGGAMSNNGEGYEGYAIAAAAMGGTSMSGGEGNLVGTFIGALIMAVVYNGLNLLRVDSYWHQVFVGAIILLAVIMDKARLRLLENVN